MATPSTFSYAQAAKGQVGSSSVSTSQPSHQSGPQPALSKTITAVTPASLDSSVDPPDTSRQVMSGSVPTETQAIESSYGSEVQVASDISPDKRPGSNQDDDAGRLDKPWRRTENDTQSSVATTHSGENHESTTSHKHSQAKTADKDASDEESNAGKSDDLHQVPTKVELFEAPIPSVNIWQQRREAMAKSKPIRAYDDALANGLSKPLTDSHKTVVPSRDSSLPSDDSASINGTRHLRKTSDHIRPEREHNGSRCAKAGDKDTKDRKSGLPTPVDDAASWPTPETAVKEVKRKPSNATQMEKESKDGSEEMPQNKTRQKEKWVAYDYVPSVNFETQLPQMRSAKSRGGARAANGTPRATGGAHSHEKTASSVTASKVAESRDGPRDGLRDGGYIPSRTTSVPPAAKRTSMDASHFRDSRKTSGHGSGHSTNDRVKEATIAHSSEQNHASRDRSDGRSDRSRGGGYRRGGNHHALSMHSQHQHSGGYAAGPMATRPPPGPYSPPPRQSGHNQMFMQAPPRGGRGRSGASANFHRMSLPNGSSRLPGVQAQFSPYEYPVAPLSAMSFQPQQPYMDSMVLQMLKGQIEYYFSIENLCKDMFLRKRMDSQGFVDLHFVAAFKRIRELTSDMGMIRAVCESSPDIEFVIGEDEVERIRRRSGWQNFVLPMHERENVARNNGPAHMTFKSRAYGSGPHYNNMTPGPYSIASPLVYNGEAHFQPMFDANTVAGMSNGTGGVSQLSAEVPDFSPSGLGSMVGVGSHAVDGDGLDKNAGARSANATSN